VCISGTLFDKDVDLTLSWHKRFDSTETTERGKIPYVKLPTSVGSACKQGDRIGQIFAHWAIVYFGQFFDNNKSSTNLWKLCTNFSQPWGRATFWAILLQTHLVTMLVRKSLSLFVGFTDCPHLGVNNLNFDILSFDILLFVILLFDILLFDILLFDILLFYILLFYILLFYILLFYILLFNILLFYILLFYILLFYILLFYILLFYILLFDILLFDI
jgi:hypothetical protein